MNTTCYKCTDDLDLDMKEWEEAWNMDNHLLLVRIFLMLKDFRHGYTHDRIQDRYEWQIPLMNLEGIKQKYIKCK